MSSQALGYIYDQELKSKAGVSSSQFAHHRLTAFRFLLFGAFILLTLRLFWLQVVQGERNRILSEENRILARSIQAPRGVITDRNGVILAQNVPVYQRLLEECVGGDDIHLELLNNGAFPDYCPAYETISRDEALKLEAEGKSIQLRTLVGRLYAYGPEIAHLVGYVGEVNKDDLANSPDYLLGDLIGKMGVEMNYETLLHGRGGAALVEIDAMGDVVRDVARREPRVGTDLTLSADVRLQQKAYELLNGREGGLVALDPRNGNILALASSPSFDPNDVVQSLEQEDQPFFNRVLGGLYPPGSVFKIVTAIAGLEEQKIDSSTEFEDTGEIIIGPYRYGNWYFDQYGRKEGLLRLVGAMKRSNDIFFYNVGELVGATKLSEWAKAFGFGRETGIDLPGEVAGIVPSPVWKERQKGERWFLGNTYHFAIGQSDLTVTPLQVSVMTAAAATGKICTPKVLYAETALTTLMPISGESMGDCEALGVSEQSRRLVQEGMIAACNPGGTAFPFFDFQVERDRGKERMEVACKTGTSEFGDPQDRTHAWFTVYAPIDNPKIVVTVLLEKAGEGSYEAAPVAKEFLQYYFKEVASN